MRGALGREAWGTCTSQECAKGVESDPCQSMKLVCRSSPLRKLNHVLFPRFQASQSLADETGQQAQLDRRTSPRRRPGGLCAGG